MTDLAEAARATRKYKMRARQLGCEVAGRVYVDLEEAQAACDRLNLLAVLDALREPNEEMANAAEAAIWGDDCMVVNVWRAMIDAAIAEVSGK